MYVLFLDVDGVLISFAKRSVFSEECMLNLKRIVDETRATIVITSNWKRSEDDLKRLEESFIKYKITFQSPLQFTPEGEFLKDIANTRVQGILIWLLDLNTKITNWVAVDDMDLSKGNEETMKGHFVRTNREKGITKENAHEILSLLLADQTGS
eukprot:TRINITY_DN2230_c0_g1_i4.p1 TRINITY_DN2230_c0_g1~~TRINITY_DN2230_c0_g1_i4.p1  ORF type:complete len:154 (-),score=29.14 TRINITY_DN2230_c0_g1_i4:81-542(-)